MKIFLQISSNYKIFHQKKTGMSELFCSDALTLFQITHNKRRHSALGNLTIKEFTKKKYKNVA